MESVPSNLPIMFFLAALTLLMLGFYLLRQKKKYESLISNRQKQIDENPIEVILEQLSVQYKKIENNIEHGLKELNSLNEGIAQTKSLSKFIDIGLPPPTFRLGDSESLKENIKKCRDEQYNCIARGNATDAISNWTFFGSKSDGEKMTGDYRSLLLKAFNSEFETIRKKMRLNSYDVAFKKIYRLNEQLTKLGETVGAFITTQYLEFKIKELTVWHQELVRLDELKQIKKTQQAALRAQRSSGDDVDELDEEIGVTESQLKRAQRSAEKLVGEERARMQLRIDEIEEEKRRLEEKYCRAISQAQLTRAGYVYVISNHGSFGESVVKIGMTRRLEPMDRVIELGDASVPYKFDVHTLAFVEDAPNVEKTLHELFSDNRVNKENLRKEFFITDPKTVKEAMVNMGIESDWYFDTEAKEFRESELIRSTLHAQTGNTKLSSTLPASI
ncbi:DUF4041 domain-containing protein [Aeromonas sobria]|uniref:DUF4041 domain-containing protein n=1 Tax=Aeromonas sobria TaxID=646 RepID=UPI00111A3748|nr:DUF4041 domain-containing protein [Aeromonas sobria]TNH94859.1 hypothetical protein CF137_11815 [Aeromonas sobria]